MKATMDVKQLQERITEQYRARTPASERAFRKALRVLPGGVTRSITFFPPYPQTLARGEGCTVHDLDDNPHRDFLNNYTALVHGHSHPATVAAITKTAASGVVYHAPVELQQRLAHVIQGRVASVHELRFTNSGSEAVMNALRLARAYTGRPKVLKMEGAFHGSYDGVALSVHPGPNAPAWPTPVPETPALAPRIGEGVLVTPYNDVERTAKIIEASRRELAAVIVEPMSWAAGAVPARRDFLDMLETLTREHGIVFIMDEVVTSRLSPGGGQEIYGVSPDLTVFGKVIGGGLPIGAFGGRSDVMALLDPRRKGSLAQAGTFSGSPLSMAAGIAALDALDAAAIHQLNEEGDRLRERLGVALREAGIAATITGLGSLGCIHFGAGPITNYREALRADKAVLPWFHLALRNRGVIIDSRGHFALSTPMTPDDHASFVEAAVDAATEIRPLISS